MDSPRSSKVMARHSAEILQSMKNAHMRREHILDRSSHVDEASNDASLKKSNTCQLENCLVCEKDTPFWLLTRNPTWSSIMRVVFYALMQMFPEKQYFSLRTDVYRFVVDHWQKICVSKKRSENWKKQLQDTLSHNKKLFASGYSLYKQNGYWGLKQIIDPWAVNDYIEEDDEDNSEDMEYLELRAMRVEILGDLTRLEERIAEVREGVEHATAMARRSDLLLDEVRSQAEAELFEIGEEVKKMYESKVQESGVIATTASYLWHSTSTASHLYSLPPQNSNQEQITYLHTIPSHEVIIPSTSSDCDSVTSLNTS